MSLIHSRPLIPVSPQGLDEIAESLLQKTPASPPSNAGVSPPSPARNVNNPGDYIILEGKVHDAYTYPDLLVAMNTRHQGTNWRDAHVALDKEGAFMLGIRQFVDFLTLLKSGNAYDGLGKKLSTARLKTIYEDIVAVRDPWRSEWLDADFKVLGKKFGTFGGKVAMHYEHKIVNGTLTPSRANEVLVGYCAKDKTPGISLDDWLARATYQGLPPADVKDGALYYWQPGKDDNSVAGFCADSGRAGLNCVRDPSLTVATLGVRAARKKN
ncbi:MAG: hypothetical protein Q7R87_04245 [Nanoarchaeota archaeon]|nr:hypothetical protein [Nanoarchaeota archaeon]